MFRFDLTTEDLRIVADREEKEWAVRLFYTGPRNVCDVDYHQLSLTDAEFSKIIAVCLGDDGNGSHPFYESADLILEKFKVPKCLRPIP